MIKGDDLIYKQNDLNNMLFEVMNDAINAGIPINETIENKVYIDIGENKRAGFCNWCLHKYEIHITDKMMYASKKHIKDILAHEILHTCFLAKTHSYPWNYYADIMNKTYGYGIKEKYNNWKEIGVKI